MAKPKRYPKGKVNRIVVITQREINEKYGDDFVYFREWYMTIENDELVVNVSYVVTPEKSRKRPYTRTRSVVVK